MAESKKRKAALELSSMCIQNAREGARAGNYVSDVLASSGVEKNLPLFSTGTSMQPSRSRRSHPRESHGSEAGNECA
jgi:hypothetical protein